MPKNPFGSDDPLAAGGAWGATGQGTGGFGADAGRGQAYAADTEQYDVVDIAEPTGPSPATIAGSNGKAAGGGSQSLAAREAALKKREAEVARREAQLQRNAAGFNPMLVKNWPRCYPIVHHDISGDIPEGKRGITRAGFFIFLLTCLSLLWNMVAVIIACIIGPVRNIAATIILAIIYFIVGVPGAWVTWYQRLYKGMISDGAVSFATFFCFFMIHIAFAIWSAIAPSIGDLKAGAAHTGFLPAIDFVKGSGGGDKLAGILYFVGAALWTFLAVISFLYLGRVYKFFRTSGLEERAREQARNEAVRQGVRSVAR